MSKTISRGRGGWIATGLAAGDVLPGRRRWVRAAGGARAGDGGGDPAGPVSDHAGDRDAGVCRILPAIRAARLSPTQALLTV